MADYLPVLLVGAVIGIFAVAFIIAYFRLRTQMMDTEHERTMSDTVIIKRLLGYAKPYWKQFVLVLVIMLVSIGYNDRISFHFNRWSFILDVLRRVNYGGNFK